LEQLESRLAAANQLFLRRFDDATSDYSAFGDHHVVADLKAVVPHPFTIRGGHILNTQGG